MKVSEGKKVSIEYTLRLDDDSVVATNVGGEPLTYTHGAHQIVPGLETGLDGMQAGETRTVTVSPEQGYGPPDPQAFQEVSKEQIPPEALNVGTSLRGHDSEGHDVRARIAEVRDASVLLDFNHPLAGKTLHFDVKVVNIQEQAAS
jgi:FKBP-type peptidyl-prolyl cis-trans isomerase 2